MTVPLSLLSDFVGREIVLDMTSPFVHLGRLVRHDELYLELEQVDVHDLRDSTTSRELYILDSRRFGIRVNRARVLVKLSEVVSLSALEDILLH